MSAGNAMKDAIEMRTSGVMMMRKRVIVPETKDQPEQRWRVSSSFTETVAFAARVRYNRLRKDKGQPALKRMPNGTRYDSLRSVCA